MRHWPRLALRLTATLTVAGCGGEVPPEAEPDLAMAPADLAPPPLPSPCLPLKLPARPFSEGPYGTRRDELAADFTLPTESGPWTLRSQWSGCESYVFVPDSWAVSALDRSSIWESDLDLLIEKSPPNVHYFFVSRGDDDAAVKKSLGVLRPQIAAVLKSLPAGGAPGQRDWWTARLHLVTTGARSLDGWAANLIRSGGPASTTGLGFAIDRAQRLRALGNLADVGRFDQGLKDANQWPWRNNLAYAAHPPIYFNYEAEREALLAAQKNVTVVTAWEHQILGGTVEKDITLPDAKAMATFDTLEVDLDMNCPAKDKIENNNCGAWDYIVRISIRDQDGKTWHELARFISTYHRAGRYLVDASQLLPVLAAGGTRHIKYEVSPPWNMQAYDTVMRFRLRNQGLGRRPTKAQFLFAGGGFNGKYNDNRLPVSVAIPANAKRVELRALITGHGGETNNCAEFCNHQHEFTIGAMKFVKAHPEVGNPEGCMEQIGKGTVPNQSGTWWFGRGGWCPGAQVEPWIVDVTAAARPGQTTMISYRGLYGASPPSTNRGNIDLSSWLVMWE